MSVTIDQHEYDKLVLLAERGALSGAIIPHDELRRLKTLANYLTTCDSIVAQVAGRRILLMIEQYAPGMR